MKKKFGCSNMKELDVVKTPAELLELVEKYQG